MARVNTALGLISADELGVTLMHEHLIIGLPGWECDALVEPYDQKAISAVCVQKLKEAKALGLKTMVDATPNDLYRDVELAKMVSSETHINIICATGMYTEPLGGNVYFRSRMPLVDVAKEFYETFMKEITQGIGSTNVKAGVIKVATGPGQITAYEKVVFTAAARAQKETGVPIITHTTEGTMGSEQADLLISEGAYPERIMIGHMCYNDNLHYHLSLMEKGVFIGFDQMGKEIYKPDAQRENCLTDLLSKGCAGKIMLSQDHVSHYLGRSRGIQDSVQQLSPNSDKAHILKRILPFLKQAGVNASQINTMMIENPRRFFA